MDTSNSNPPLSPVRPREESTHHVTLPDRDGIQVEVIHCSTVEALIQEAGRFKFCNDGPVYFRGQRKLYEPGVPSASIYRDSSTCNTAIKELDRLLFHLAGADAQSWYEFAYGPDFIEHNMVPKNKPFHDIPFHSLEGLLQHYGLKTRWLDITDSIPHAIFFALAQYETVKMKTDNIASNYDPKTKGSCCSRIMNNELVFLNPSPDEEDICYIMAISVGEPRKQQSDHKGLCSCKNGLVLDVRESIPSYYLRPHMQHGLLYMPHIEQPNCSGDEHSNIRFFEIPSNEAIRWLGNGTIFSAGSIYPPIRRIINRPPTPIATTSIDRGLSEIEQTLIEIVRENAPNVTLDDTIYKPLTQITNYVTKQSLADDQDFEKENKRGKSRIDWCLPQSMKARSLRSAISSKTLRTSTPPCRNGAPTSPMLK